MKRHTAAFAFTLALAGAGPLPAAEAPRAEATVELPPMLIAETSGLPPWLYTRAGDSEYLARCSERITRDYAEMRAERLRWLHSLFPAEILAKSDLPIGTLLVSQRYKPTNNAEIVGEVLDTQRRRGGGYVRATTAPNMMLNDAEIVGVFAYIDENNFQRENFTISSDYLRFLLERRSPAVPGWLREGIVSLYTDVEFPARAVTLRPLAWPAVAESLANAGRPEMARADVPRPTSPAAVRASQALVRNPEAPRVLLSATELFGEAAWVTHAQLALAQANLFVRWGIDPRNGMRDKFWTFARRACAEPLSEALFEACFGFGFSDLRDRLSDYLPLAVKEPLWLPLAGESPAATVVRPATPAEVARLRGEWERLSVPLVQRRHAAEVERYRTQARRTLQRAYDEGERDAGLLASLGLLEVEAGNDLLGQGYLDEAVAKRVVRPRAYYEIARIRWTQVSRGAAPTRLYETEELEPIVLPLRAGLAQSPLLPGAAELFADIWLRGKTAPGEEDVALLRAAARTFVLDARIALRIARTLGRHGRLTDGAAVLEATFPHVRDEALRAQFAQLYGALTKKPAAK